MKKEKKENSESKSSTPAMTNVRNYFTEEINKRVEEMTVKEMESILKSLINTDHWVALLKYNEVRLPMLDSILRSTDPIKDASRISWTQGCMAGLWDVPTYIIDLNNNQERTTTDEGTPGGISIGN